MSHPPESSTRPFPVAAAVLVSVVLGGLVLLARPWGILQGLGVALGVATLVAAIQVWRTGDRRYMTGVLLALSLQVGVFLAGVAGTPQLARFRLVQAAALLGFGAILASELLVRWGSVAPRRAELWALAFALAILGGDAILGLGAPPNHVPSRRDWPDSSDPHPRLGRVPRPYAAFKTFYPDDRQGYLLEEDVRAKSWVLTVMPGSVADLVLPREHPELLRVAIRKTSRDTVWHVQLGQSRFAIESQVPYFIAFRARADRPRKAVIAFSQNHPPWASLGLYQSLDLTPEWKEFREVFVPRRADTNSMIVFHLAGSDVPVEVDSVALHGPPSGRRIDPTLSTERFSIRHQRNALGCRDRDYPVPRPANTIRILALGDEFTSGLGVNEKDTFARLLERELNQPAPKQPHAPGFEVINCGVSGYGTREQRLFFELFGATYKPDLVLVTMGWNDDQFYWEARQRELLQRGPSRLERLSSVLHRIGVSLRLRRTYDYHRSVEDLLALDKVARGQGARLIVAVSRHGPDGLGDSVLATVRKGLAGSEIPLLDLGRPIPTDSVPGDPEIPPGPGAHRAVALELLRWLRKDILPDEANTANATALRQGRVTP